jgi:uncharacterized protein
MEVESAIDLGRLAQDLQLKKLQVQAVVDLLDSGNTVPFITRYRKEQTGGLDEEQIRAVQHRVERLRQLAERRQIVLRTIESQGKLTDELRTAIEQADTPKRLEDLYLPYKPKKQSLATLAKEKGLGPLAEAIWRGDEAASNLAEVLPGMVDPDKQLATVDDVLAGLQHILAERIAEDADVRDAAREVLWAGSLKTSRASSAAQPEASRHEPGPVQNLDEFRNYFQYEEPIRRIPPHRMLAINRGERRGVLKVRLEFDRGRMIENIRRRLPLDQHPHLEFLERCIVDAVDRLLIRSLEREIRGEVTEFAELHAVDVFARNLRNLLLQPPLHHRRVLAVDPGYRTGCKWAVLDDIGNVLEHGTVFPHVRRKKKKKKKGGVAPEPIEAGGAAAQHGDEEILPPPQSADAAYRDTEPGAAEDHGLEAELERDWREVQSRIPEPKIPARPRSAAAPPADRRPLHPAFVGVVIPPPGVFPDAPEQSRRPPPAASVSRREKAKEVLAELCRRHNVDVLALGNGTACRETEELVAEMHAEGRFQVPYVIVNEAGASVYSTSPVGREEFPEFDATLRSAISIGRRLQDPLSELVKIDPQNIGVGLYQHDINPRTLKQSLSEVVESCVNYVGVDLNTASVPLLRYVSGLNQLRAKNLVEYRRQNGPFRSREQIRDVPGVGPETFTQAAGFLKIAAGDEPFDRTWIHPESYGIAEKVLERLGFDRQALVSKQQGEELREKVYDCRPREIAEQLGAGEPTIRDILDNLVRPGRDPREDLPKPIFRTGILKLEDLSPGLELKGTVLNVVDFGVFVDIGLKDSGLVHISELADRFVRDPHDVVAVGDVVTTWVLRVDMDRRRVSLTMIHPARREQRSQRPPREARGAEQPRASAAPRSATEPAARTPRAPARPPRRTAERRKPPSREKQPGTHRRERPKRSPPPPAKLSEEKLSGREALHTFGELKALFEYKRRMEDGTNAGSRPARGGEPADAKPSDAKPSDAEAEVSEAQGGANPEAADGPRSPSDPDAPA